jgi:hypothetical protein
MRITMAKWNATVVYKQYFEVEIEADTWEQAKDSIPYENLSYHKPIDAEWDIYDLDEVKE